MPLTAHPVARGASLIVAGMAAIGFIDNFVWVIAAEVSVWQFHLVRSAMALPALALAAALGLRLRPNRPGRVAARAAVQGTAMLLYFASLGFLPIAQVGAGLFTAPLFVLLLAALLFRERIGPRRLAAVAAGFAGVLMILRPDPATMGPEALMPLAAGALYGLGNLLTREWCADEPVGALLAAFFAALGLIGAAGCLVLALHPAAGPATFLTSRAPGARPSPRRSPSPDSAIAPPLRASFLAPSTPSPPASSPAATSSPPAPPEHLVSGSPSASPCGGPRPWLGATRSCSRPATTRPRPARRAPISLAPPPSTLRRTENPAPALIEQSKLAHHRPPPAPCAPPRTRCRRPRPRRRGLLGATSRAPATAPGLRPQPRPSATSVPSETARRPRSPA